MHATSKGRDIWENRNMNTPKNQSVKQRVGKLIEQHICVTHHLMYNKRQQTKGYFDAYNKDHIFEIKATKVIKNQDPRIIIIKKNHKDLDYTGYGKYIIVLYDLTNKDKDLQLIQDINILQEIVISAKEISKLISEHGTSYNRNFKGHIKEYIRLKISWLGGSNGS